jgi:hypothetical protein
VTWLDTRYWNEVEEGQVIWGRVVTEVLTHLSMNAVKEQRSSPLHIFWSLHPFFSPTGIFCDWVSSSGNFGFEWSFHDDHKHQTSRHPVLRRVCVCCDVRACYNVEAVTCELWRVSCDVWTVACVLWRVCCDVCELWHVWAVTCVSCDVYELWRDSYRQFPRPVCHFHFHGSNDFGIRKCGPKFIEIN